MSALAHQSARKGDGDLTRLSAADLAEKLATREVSSVEATQAHLDRIAAVDGDIHAFLHVSDHALDVAADIDRRRAAGESLGPVAGVPLAIKDVLVTTDMPSTSGSRILEGYMSPFDATVVARSRAMLSRCSSSARAPRRNDVTPSSTGKPSRVAATTCASAPVPWRLATRNAGFPDSACPARR